MFFFLRGHGTQDALEDGQKVLQATVAGFVQRVNKLICVLPLHSRYLTDFIF